MPLMTLATRTTVSVQSRTELVARLASCDRRIKHRDLVDDYYGASATRSQRRPRSPSASRRIARYAVSQRRPTIRDDLGFAQQITVL